MKLQWVWRDEGDWYFGFWRVPPCTPEALIYRWILFVGPVEVRRWANLRTGPQ